MGHPGLCRETLSQKEGKALHLVRLQRGLRTNILSIAPDTQQTSWKCSSGPAEGRGGWAEGWSSPLSAIHRYLGPSSGLVRPSHLDLGANEKKPCFCIIKLTSCLSQGYSRLGEITGTCSGKKAMDSKPPAQSVNSNRVRQVPRGRGSRGAVTQDSDFPTFCEVLIISQQLSKLQ